MIKKTVLLFAGCFMTAGLVAQQRYSDQWVTGMSGAYMPSSGYNASVFLEKYIRDSFSSIKLEALYMNQQIAADAVDFRIDCGTYGGAVSYNYSLEKLIPSPFYVNLSIGGIGAYQKVDYDDTMMEVNAENKFVYGFTTSIQFEVIAYKSLSFFIEPKAYYLMNSDIRKMNGSIGAGLKIYL